MKTKEDLEKLYNRHLSLRFPEAADNDSLYDCQMEILKHDGFIIGVLTSFIDSGKLPQNKEGIDLEKILLQLDTMEIDPKKDSRALKMTKEYLASLMEIWTSLFK